MVHGNPCPNCLGKCRESILHNEIQNSSFKGYYTDIEYNRNSRRRIKTIINDEYKVTSITCDLIVHSRGKQMGQDNLIAIEMKKSSAKVPAKMKDKVRLMALTKDSYDDVWSYDGKTLPEHVCRYLLGIYYEIDFSNRSLELEYYSKGKMDSKEVIEF